MTVQCRIDPPILRLDLSPPYCPEEVEAELRRIAGGEGHEPNMDILVAVHGRQNTPAREIRRYASIMEGSIAEIGSRISVVTDNDLSYGLARMFAVFAAPSGRDVAVFRDLGAAEAWILSDDDDQEEAQLPPAAAGQG